MLVGLLFLAVGGGILSRAHDVAADPHVRFWLGDLPLFSLFASLIAVALTFMLLVRIRLVKFLRSRERDDSKRAKQLKEGARREFEPSPSTLRVLVLLICKVALGTAGVGIASIYQGLSVAHVLDHHCGEEGNSQQLEQTHGELAAVLGRCAAFDGQPGSLKLCPEFVSHFPGPQPLVDYLTRLETDIGCTGFCKSDPPLFRPKLSAAFARHPVRDRCAAVLGRDLRRTSCLVGVAGLVLGGMFLIGGTALFFYDHL